jgi:hypothetical protein
MIGKNPTYVGLHREIALATNKIGPFEVLCILHPALQDGIADYVYAP